MRMSRISEMERFADMMVWSDMIWADMIADPTIHKKYTKWKPSLVHGTGLAILAKSKPVILSRLLGVAILAKSASCRWIIYVLYYMTFLYSYLSFIYLYSSLLLAECMDH